MKWFVVQTMTRQEHRADVELRQLGLETLFLHFVEYRQVKSDPKKSRLVYESLLPGYLFVRCQPGDFAKVSKPPEREILCGTLDARGFPAPASVPDDEVQRLRNLGDKFGQLHRASRPDRLRLGHKVQITEGPLLGFFATIEDVLADGKRMRLRLERKMLMGKRDVVVDAKAVTRA
jgi:transcription antitermination factor NusG